MQQQWHLALVRQRALQAIARLLGVLLLARPSRVGRAICLCMSLCVCVSVCRLSVSVCFCLSSVCFCLSSVSVCLCLPASVCVCLSVCLPLSTVPCGWEKGTIQDPVSRLVPHLNLQELEQDPCCRQNARDLAVLDMFGIMQQHFPESLNHQRVWQSWGSAWLSPENQRTSFCFSCSSGSAPA